MSFELPALPPRPSDTPPQADPNGVLLRSWEASWRVYWQATAVHAGVANAAATNQTLATQGAALQTKSEDEVILACIAAVPPTVRVTEAAWAKDVVAMGKALFAEMRR